jgi:hypothetical protein
MIARLHNGVPLEEEEGAALKLLSLPPCKLTALEARGLARHIREYRGVEPAHDTDPDPGALEGAKMDVPKT